MNKRRIKSQPSHPLTNALLWLAWLFIKYVGGTIVAIAIMLLLHWPEIVWGGY